MCCYHHCYPPTCRGKKYLFEDFLTQWSDRLRSLESASVVSLRLQHDIENYQSIVPLLKYVGGEVLSVEHWQELFRMLEMAKGTTPEKLTFGDILQVSDLISRRSDDLKVCSVAHIVCDVHMYICIVRTCKNVYIRTYIVVDICTVCMCICMCGRECSHLYCTCAFMQMCRYVHLCTLFLRSSPTGTAEQSSR